MLPSKLKCPQCGCTNQSLLRVYAARWYTALGYPDTPCHDEPDLETDTTVECLGYRRDAEDGEPICRYRAPLADFEAAGRGEEVPVQDYSETHGVSIPEIDAGDDTGEFAAVVVEEETPAGAEVASV